MLVGSFKGYDYGVMGNDEERALGVHVIPPNQQGIDGCSHYDIVTIFAFWLIPLSHLLLSSWGFPGRCNDQMS